jgi:hypothetical protein
MIMPRCHGQSRRPRSDRRWAAIERGESIAIDDTGSFTNVCEIRFEQAPKGNPVTLHRARKISFRRACRLQALFGLF